MTTSRIHRVSQKAIIDQLLYFGSVLCEQVDELEKSLHRDANNKTMLTGRLKAIDALNHSIFMRNKFEALAREVLGISEPPMDFF